MTPGSARIWVLSSSSVLAHHLDDRVERPRGEHHIVDRIDCVAKRSIRRRDEVIHRALTGSLSGPGLVIIEAPARQRYSPSIRHYDELTAYRSSSTSGPHVARPGWIDDRIDWVAGGRGEAWFGQMQRPETDGLVHIGIKTMLTRRFRICLKVPRHAPPRR
jgi:hypothetical protein